MRLPQDRILHIDTTTNTATYRRTQMFEVGADWKGGDSE